MKILILGILKELMWTLKTVTLESLNAHSGLAQGNIYYGS